jgi:hypothetical protein
MIRLLFFAALWLASSQANAHDLRADADPANDWIEGLANGEDAAGCGTHDCYPLQRGSLQFSPDGDFTVEIGGEWFLVLERYLLRDVSPDGRAWACPQWESTGAGFMRRVQRVRCLLLPMVM